MRLTSRKIVIQTDRDRDRQTDRQTDTQTDREINGSSERACFISGVLESA